jgi:drug/metabolite transporter (DMT)-like permease
MTAASLRSTFTTFRAALMPWRYHVLMVVGSIAGSWAPILTRLAHDEGVPSLFLVAFRQIVAALVLTPFVLHYYRAELRGLRRREIAFAALAGFWFAVHLMAGFEGLNHTSVLVCNVLIGTTPLWIALVRSVRLEKSPQQVGLDRPDCHADRRLHNHARWEQQCRSR